MSSVYPTWPGWECVRIIGKESFGTVYEICRTEFGIKYTAALKVITIPHDPADIRDAAFEGMSSKEIKEYYHGMIMAAGVRKKEYLRLLYRMAGRIY